MIDDERERRKGGREEGLEGRKEGRWRGRREEERKEGRKEERSRISGSIWDILSWPKHLFGFFCKMFPNFWPTQN